MFQVLLFCFLALLIVGSGIAAAWIIKSNIEKKTIDKQPLVFSPSLYRQTETVDV